METTTNPFQRMHDAGLADEATRLAKAATCAMEGYEFMAILRFLAVHNGEYLIGYLIGCFFPQTEYETDTEAFLELKDQAWEFVEKMESGL